MSDMGDPDWYPMGKDADPELPKDREIKDVELPEPEVRSMAQFGLGNKNIPSDMSPEEFERRLSIDIGNGINSACAIFGNPRLSPEDRQPSQDRGYRVMSHLFLNGYKITRESTDG